MSAEPRVIPHLVRASELVAMMGQPDVRIVDVRWRLGDPAAGRTGYARGHIPGAVFADLDHDLAEPPGDGGRHPLPSPDRFASAMLRLGIGDDTRVIAYDDQEGAIAARLWFLLRYFGHETGAVLDGGLMAFVQTGRVLETDPGTATAVGPFHATPRPELVLDRGAVMARLRRPGVLLLDARSPERYRGELEPVDPRPGHIPSAVNAPFQDNLLAGRFLAEEALRERYGALGAWDKETAVYCGSGVTACHDLLALAVAGLPTARLYAGSWSEWSRDPSAPVSVG
jgi:thiosulfate/3-mercaptopyruvate sulfurtransferase